MTGYDEIKTSSWTPVYDPPEEPRVAPRAKPIGDARTPMIIRAKRTADGADVFWKNEEPYFIENESDAWALPLDQAQAVIKALQKTARKGAPARNLRLQKATTQRVYQLC